MSPGNRSPRSLVQFALTLLAWVAAPTHAGELHDLKMPAPITSAQHEKTLKEAALPPAERAALDAAFDAYVDEWQRLRDRTLRPLAAELEQVNAQMVKESMAAARSARETPLPERSPEQAQAEMDAFRHQQEVAAATRAELRTKARQGYERIGQLDARLVAALRAGPRTPEQSQVIDALAQDRARRLAAAMIRSMGAREPTALLARLPAPPKALDADVTTAITERLARLERESLPLLQRIAAASLAQDDDKTAAGSDIEKLVRLRMKAIDELGGMLPADAGAKWVESARGRMLGTFQWSAPTAPRAAIEEAIGARMDAAARKRLDRWTAERRAIEDELMLGGSDWKFQNERTEALKALDSQAMTDLADSTRTPALVEEGFVMKTRMQALRDAGGSDLAGLLEDEDNPMSGMQRRMQARMQAAQESPEGADASAPAKEADAAMAAMQQRGLQRAQVDRIRDALGIPEERRAMWDTLADDVLEASSKLHDEKSLKPSDMSTDPQQTMGALLRMGEYRAEQQALEERWFDSIASGIPGLSADTLADQRSRRALQRLRDMGGLARMMSVMTGDRSGDLDLDAVIDRLPADARARIAPQVMASRDRRTRDLQASIEATEAMIREMAKLSENLKEGEQPAPEKMQALMKLQQDFGVTAKERMKRSAAAERDEVESMVTALGQQAGASLRRAMRAQQYPEVFRAMDRTDKAIDRVMSVPGLSPQQMTALGAEADAFRVRSDEIADRAITALTQAEKSTADLVTGAGDLSDPEAATGRFARMKAAEIANTDIEYDRAELASRTLRRMRAVLTAEQARAAALDTH